MATDTRIRITAEDKASRVVDNVKRELVGLSSVGARLGGLVSPLGAISAAVAGLGASVLAVKNFVNSIDDLKNAADGVGVTAVALAEMRSKAAEASVDASQLDQALGKLAQRLTQAQAGSREAAAAFEAIGIDVSKVKGTEDALGRIADKFRTYADTAEKSALASEFFGERAGRRMVAFLNQGSDGLRQFTGLTDDTVRQSLALQNQLNTLANNFEQLKNSILSAAVPAINAFFNALRGGGDLDKLRGIDAQIARIERSLKRSIPQDEFNRRQKELNDLYAERADILGRVEQAALGATAAQRAPKVPEGPKKSGKDPAETFLENLKKQAVAANYTAEQVLRIEAAQLGVSEAAEPWVKSLIAGKQAAEEAAAEIERINKLARDEERERTALVEGERREWERLAQELDRINELSGGLTRAQEQRIATLQRLFDLGMISEEQLGMGVLDVLPAIQSELKKTDDMVEQLGLTFTSAFEDALAGGKKLSDVLRSLERDILRLFTRKLITEPLLNWFGSILPGRAAGGPVSAGMPYLVGERGPELFVPRQSGAIAPNGRFGGVSLVQYNSYGAGVSRSELAPLLERNRQATIAELNSMASRNSPRLAV